MTSTRLRGAAVREKLDALHVQPVYCYAGQQNEVAAFCRRTFLMSPLRVVLDVAQITEDTPTFIYVEKHQNPVPDELWKGLAFKNTSYVKLWGVV